MNSVRRYAYLRWLLIALAPSAGAIAQGTDGISRDRLRPNVILILSDDIGYGDLGSYGAPDAKTPNLDRLAKEGVRFTESYANGAVCVPTRAALMTSRYQQRVGLEWVHPSRTERVDGERVGASWLSPEDTAVTNSGLRVTEASLPALLKRSGYATGLIGKWHLGVKTEMGPNAHGFDYFFGFLGGAVDYYAHRDPFGRHDLYEDTVEVQVPRYLTDELTARAVTFIDRHASTPFFLELAYNATHSPFQPPDQPPSDSTIPAWRGSFPIHPAPHRTRKDYVQMLERMDRGVGEVLNALAAHAITRNTLVIFTSDNGGEWLSRNAPFFNQKGTLWEGGIRVPLLMRWPGHLPAGHVTRQVAITMDLTASILAATGTPAAGSYPLDGIDLLPIVRGREPTSTRDVFWRIDTPSRLQRAVRSGKWKLLTDADGFYEVPHWMLFNLESDPGERHDLAAQDPARVADLKARIDRWERAVAPARTEPQGSIQPR